MGGTKVKPTPDQLLTLCSLCNQRVEQDLQGKALAAGWKVRRFSPVADEAVPVWFPWERSWWLLRPDGSRDRLTSAEAAELRGMAGTLPRLEAGQ